MLPTENMREKIERYREVSSMTWIAQVRKEL